MDKLLDIMKALRDPKTGCPWDIQQTFETMVPYTLEEAHEVIETIENNDMTALKDELGDLLLQVVFHSQMASEKGLFDFADVAEGICQKMTRRHPHVFGDAEMRDVGVQNKAWEDQKALERKEKDENTSILDGITLSLPALTRAVKLQKRAARVGFDWPEVSQVIEKLQEEMIELSEELINAKDNHEKIEEEFGDMMFVYANLARHLKINPEIALRKCNKKFETRFKMIEQYLINDGKVIEETCLEELDALWDKAKAELKNNKKS
jgi:MazG family protein